MQAFMSANEAARKKAARELSRNPCPNRPAKHYQRIRRALDEVAARTHLCLEETQYYPFKWLPCSGVVHEKDDEYQYDLQAQLYPDDYRVEEDGYLTDWHDPGIKATNRIMAITWYDSTEGEGFIIKKPVLCPLPCSQWGRLPITLAQWRSIAMILIEAEQLWRWLHAVRYYTDNQNYKPTGIVGWHMEPTTSIVSHQKLADEGKGYIIDMRTPEEREGDTEGWTVRNLYLDIIAGFSLED